MGVDEPSERLLGLVRSQGERAKVVRDVLALVFPASYERLVEEAPRLMGTLGLSGGAWGARFAGKWVHQSVGAGAHGRRLGVGEALSSVWCHR